MELIPVLLFAFAVSLDSFGVGLSYGIRKIVVPWFSIIIICLTSSIATIFSMFFGNMIAHYISPLFAEKIGAIIMVVVGIGILYQAVMNICKNKSAKKQNTNFKSNVVEQHIIKFKILKIGIIIQILQEPAEADFDRSGEISMGEALILGIALAIDALGAGFGAAVAGYQLWLVPIFVGSFNLTLLSFGLCLGQKWEISSLGEKGTLLPGLILIFLGLRRF